MPNPVAVNDLSPISGSLQTSRISYAVETAGKNYGQDYNGTTWYSDIPQNGSQYTIISDNYTANYYVSRSNAEGAYVEGGLPAVDEYSAPVFWLTAGTSSLDIITIVNGLPDRRGQIPFNSGSQALNWVASSSNYFAVGPPYEQIDADNLVFCVQGNQIISYPTTGSTWYDLSGYYINGTLTNGTSWNSTNYMVFDGTDDYIDFGTNSVFNVGTTGSLSIDVLFKTTDFIGALVTKRLGSGPQVYVYSNKLYADGGGTAGVYSANNVNNNRWTRGTVVYDRASSLLRLYVNGVADNTIAFGSTTLTDSGNLYLGAASFAGYPYDFYTGSIAETLIYPKALTAAEVAQNYYGGPIVTGSLLFAIDAGNLVSYPKSGTTVYPLTGSGATGTLTNGVGFSNVYDGTWVFDGTDDYIVTDVGTPNITSKTLEAWVSLNDVTQQGGGVINLQYDGGSTFDAIVYNEIGQGWGFGSDGFSRTAWSGVVETVPNQWIHIVATYENNNFRMYRNSVLILTTTSFSALNYNTNSESLLGLRHNGAGNGYLNASIAVGRIYSRALTAAEVLQNYNATK
jgi:hypothetical protein